MVDPPVKLNTAEFVVIETMKRAFDRGEHLSFGDIAEELATTVSHVMFVAESLMEKGLVVVNIPTETLN